MTDSEIPEPVKAFIADHVDSLASLEILLLLHGEQTKEYAAQDVARELRIEPSGAASRLATLRASGMLASRTEADPMYRFEPNSIALRQTIDQLAEAYASHRVSITTLIFTKPSDALRSFADAFRIRKDRHDG